MVGALEAHAALDDGAAMVLDHLRQEPDFELRPVQGRKPIHHVLIGRRHGRRFITHVVPIPKPALQRIDLALLRGDDLLAQRLKLGMNRFGQAHFGHVDRHQW